MKLRKEYINKILLCLYVIVISVLPVQAANNSLLAIDVKQNIGNDYNVILKLDGNTNVRKIINSSNIILVG